MQYAVGDIVKKMQAMMHGSIVSESYAELIDLLTNVMAAGTSIKIVFTDASYTYQSKITAVNAKHRVMLTESGDTITPFFPKPGRPALIVFNIQSREIQLHTKFIDYLAPDSNLGIEFSIPDTFVAKRPREAFRLFLDEFNDKVKVRMIGAEKFLLDGIVKNISRLGLGVKTDAQIQNLDNQVVTCKMFLDAESEVECKMEIRNVRQLSNSDVNGAGTFIGGRILSIEGLDNKVFSNFLANLRRKQFTVYA